MDDQGGAPPAPDMSPRERRRQQARKVGSTRAPIRWGKVIPPLLVGSLVLIMILIPFKYDAWFASDACPGHWHSTMKVFVNETEVDFSRYNLENGNTPIWGHFHRNDAQWKWHFEPSQKRCIPFRTAIQNLGMELTPTSISFDGLHAGPYVGTHKEVGNLTVRAFHHLPDATAWTEITIPRLLDRQLKDGEKVLIVYGEQTTEQLTALWEQVPDPYQRVPGVPA